SIYEDQVASTPINSVIKLVCKQQTLRKQHFIMNERIGKGTRKILIKEVGLTCHFHKAGIGNYSIYFLNKSYDKITKVY
ncbi:hypothetical protein J7I91_24515, partial [Pseudomonas sp. ISL-84]|nr:hypothetical protein [Pseudomonas sp. ISL-84]